MSTRTGFALLAAAATLACASTPNGEKAGAAGCYYFEQDAGARDLNLPWGVRFEDGPLEGWPALSEQEGVHPASTLRQEGETDFPFGYWAETHAGIEIGYPGGGGLVLELTWEGGQEGKHRTLVGLARPAGDAMPPGGASARVLYTVRLERAQCPGEAAGG